MSHTIHRINQFDLFKKEGDTIPKNYGGIVMANSNNSNKVEVPNAKEALNRFKQEVASELGVPLKEGYNGDLTSKQAGSIGGEMVRKMIKSQEERMSSEK